MNFNLGWSLDELGAWKMARSFVRGENLGEL